MCASHHELLHLASNLQHTHGAAAVALASLICISQALLRRHGEQHGTDVEPLLVLQATCLEHWAETHAVPRRAVLEAVAGLKRASATASYLDAVPSDRQVLLQTQRGLSLAHCEPPRAPGHAPYTQPCRERLLADPDAALRDLFMTLHGCYRHERRESPDPGANHGYVVLRSPEPVS